VRKLIKQTKAFSWLSCQRGFDQFRSSKAKSNVGATGTRVLWKADPAVRKELSSLNLFNRVLNQSAELISLFLRDGRAQVLDFNQPFAHKNDLRNIRDARHPRIADQLWIERYKALRFFLVATGRGLPFEQAPFTVQLPDGIDVSDEIIVAGEWSHELDLQVATRLGNPDAVVLNEAFQQLNALPQHVLPAVVRAIFNWAVLMGTPLLEEDGCGVLVQKKCSQRLFEYTAEEHAGAGILLLPAIEIPVAVATWTGEIVTDLGVAVGHQAISEPVGLPAEEAVDSSSHWLAGAKPSKFSKDLPFRVVWLILTTPRRPNRAFSSISSRPISSGS
jgi:hypothetical protein